MALHSGLAALPRARWWPLVCAVAAVFSLCRTGVSGNDAFTCDEVGEVAPAPGAVLATRSLRFDIIHSRYAAGVPSDPDFSVGVNATAQVSERISLQAWLPNGTLLATVLPSLATSWLEDDRFVVSVAFALPPPALLGSNGTALLQVWAKFHTFQRRGQVLSVSPHYLLAEYTLDHSLGSTPADQNARGTPSCAGSGYTEPTVPTSARFQGTARTLTVPPGGIELFVEGPPGVHEFHFQGETAVVDGYPYTIKSDLSATVELFGSKTTVFYQETPATTLPHSIIIHTQEYRGEAIDATAWTTDPAEIDLLLAAFQHDPAISLEYQEAVPPVNPALRFGSTADMLASGLTTAWIVFSSNLRPIASLRLLTNAQTVEWEASYLRVLQCPHSALTPPFSSLDNRGYLYEILETGMRIESLHAETVTTTSRAPDLLNSTGGSGLTVEGLPSARFNVSRLALWREFGSHGWGLVDEATIPDCASQWDSQFAAVGPMASCQLCPGDFPYLRLVREHSLFNAGWPANFSLLTSALVPQPSLLFKVEWEEAKIVVAGSIAFHEPRLDASAVCGSHMVQQLDSQHVFIVANTGEVDGWFEVEVLCPPDVAVTMSQPRKMVPAMGARAFSFLAFGPEAQECLLTVSVDRSAARLWSNAGKNVSCPFRTYTVGPSAGKQATKGNASATGIIVGSVLVGLLLVALLLVMWRHRPAKHNEEDKEMADEPARQMRASLSPVFALKMHDESNLAIDVPNKRQPMPNERYATTNSHAYDVIAAYDGNALDLSAEVFGERIEGEYVTVLDNFTATEAFREELGAFGTRRPTELLVSGYAQNEEGTFDEVEFSGILDIRLHRETNTVWARTEGNQIVLLNAPSEEYYSTFERLISTLQTLEFVSET